MNRSFLKMLSHRNITSNAIAAAQVVDIQASDRALSIFPLSHMFETMIESATIRLTFSRLHRNVKAVDYEQ